ncbi:Hormonally up-regulated neu tumor-associated kinase [Gossypium arboreum]|uniref:Hormonally up-regulated neu tumor-associated kinase n=1 Tax=Gossypium arboreum TaxID=29729 RepID=A0A0B0N720_GOSAR|nr:Hormonally up-regulated neu tumor-associated kinase [Gossypium arboreum]
MIICCLSTTSHGIKCLIITKMKLSIILRTVSELEQAAGKNKNSRTQQGRKERPSSQKVGRLQLFDITHRKKDGSLMTSKAGEIMEKLKDKKAGYEAIPSSDSSVNLEDIDTELLLKFWVLKGMVGFDFKDLVLTQPNILDLARNNTCLQGVKLKLKLKG